MLLLGACAGGSGESARLVEADFGVFAEAVEPELEATCANPSCHGRADRPLELYAPGRHRLDPADTWLAGGLTDEELARNFARARTFLDPDAAASPLVRKPLDPEAGGSEHAGGTQYRDTGEPGYRVLLDWAGGEP